MFERLKKQYTSPIYYLYVAIMYALGCLLLAVLAATDAKSAELLPIKAGTACGTLRHGNGLIETLYDENQDGIPDRYTLTGLDRKSQPRPHPLFYGIDENQDGEWEAVYADPQEDGINGNETIYQSTLEEK